VITDIAISHVIVAERIDINALSLHAAIGFYLNNIGVIRTMVSNPAIPVRRKTWKVSSGGQPLPPIKPIWIRAISKSNIAVDRRRVLSMLLIRSLSSLMSAEFVGL